MSRPYRQPWLQPLGIAGLGAVLLLLAFLQYRWIGEISSAERERLERGLQSSSARFRGAFTRELIELASLFSVEPPGWTEDDWSPLIERYRRYEVTRRDLLPIEDVYVIETAGDGPRLLRLDEGTLELEPADWPDELLALRGHGRRPRAERNPRLFGWTFNPASCSLATPLIRLSGRPGRFRPPDVLGVLILRLDREAIVEQTFAAFDERYFGAADELRYRVAVVEASREEGFQRLVYSSDPAATVDDFAEADVVSPIIWERDERDERRGERRGGPPPPPPGAAAPDARSAPPPAVRGDGRRRAPGPPSRVFAAVSVGGPGPDWLLVAKHYEGSLEQAVESARKRNLAISSGILLLLGAGMAVMVGAARRSERLARMQMEFVAGVSHELRTPLAVIRSAGDNLAEGVVSVPDQVREYGKLIRDEGRRLTTMVEQTLEFSSQQSGRRRYNLETACAADLVERSIDDLRSEIDEAGFEVESEVPADLPAVRVDVSAAVECLRNLLQNALKYGGEGRWIGVRAARDGKFVRIAIADRGPGVDSKDLPHIFEAFYRGRNATERQVQGAGLGLSLARSSVEAFGGRLSVESAPDRGAIFAVYLPVAAEGSGEPGAAPSGGATSS